MHAPGVLGHNVMALLNDRVRKHSRHPIMLLAYVSALLVIQLYNIVHVIQLVVMTANLSVMPAN